MKRLAVQTNERTNERADGRMDCVKNKIDRTREERKLVRQRERENETTQSGIENP